jgi:hypothetical protein
MIEVDTSQLKRAVESQHGCTATLGPIGARQRDIRRQGSLGRHSPRIQNLWPSSGQPGLCLVIPNRGKQQAAIFCGAASAADHVPGGGGAGGYCGRA